MLSVEQLTDYIDNYGSLFKVYRHDNSRKALQYISGLFHDGKHNIERMSERIKDSDYQQLQHFISESKWDHTIVLEAVTKDISDLFSDRGNGKIPTGLIIDESGHKKVESTLWALPANTLAVSVK